MVSKIETPLNRLNNLNSAWSIVFWKVTKSLSKTSIEQRTFDAWDKWNTAKNVLNDCEFLVHKFPS